MSPAHKTHRGPILSMSWRASLPVHSRLAVGSGARSRLGQILAQIDAGPRVLVLFQAPLKDGWLQEIQDSLQSEHTVITHELADGEACKSTDSLLQIWSLLQKERFDRHDSIVAVGGGAVTDAAGFAAATYMRGIKLVLVPTTLLSQVDAAIGGKTAINLPSGKNLAGSFYFPDAVVVDPDFLSTLPAAQFTSGMGEIIKYALIEDTVAANSEYRPGPQSLLKTLQGHIPTGCDDPVLSGIITSCIKMKLSVVAVDPKEGNLRRSLNLGHTLGHALEKVSNYRLSHGEAVAIGTMFVLKTAIKKNKIGAESLAELESLLKRAGLPTEVPGDMQSEQLLDSMLQDKKRQGGTLHLVLPQEKLGLVDFDVQVKLSDLEQLL